MSLSRSLAQQRHHLCARAQSSSRGSRFGIAVSASSPSSTSSSNDACSRRRRRSVAVASSSAASSNDAFSYSNPSDAAAFVATSSSLPNDQRVRRPENVDGAFYVDSSCINCDVCRKLAPKTFSKIGPQSAVFAQPASSSLEDPVTAAAAAALVSCPTASIHAEGFKPSDVAAAAAAFLPCDAPGVVPPAEGGPPVRFLGYTSGRSFGASAYLLLLKDGNVLVDSPRFDPRLLKKIEALGGAKWFFLTHRDDVADHARWAAKLGARRIMHSKECNEQQGTDKVEAKLEGEGPWTLRDCGSSEEGGSDDEIKFVLQPGHTEACVAMFHFPSKSLFTGDVVSCGTDAGSFSEDGSPKLHA